MVPEIRLSGFNESWKKIKLGSYSKILTGGTPKTRIKEYWYPKDIPWMSSGEVNKKRLYSTDNLISNLGLENSSARWVKEKAVLIALAGQGKTRGTVAINEIPLTTNQSIAAIEVCDILSSEFLYQNLGNRYEELRLLSSGDGSRGGLNKKIISDIKIITPKIEEQQKIGSLFKNIDEVITLQQQLLTDYKQLKKALLQQLFPQKGETVPKVRFAGFSDDWKRHRLGNITKMYSGGTPSVTNRSYYNGHIPFIRSAEINSYTTELFLTEEGVKNSSAKMVESGDILYALYGATSGKVGISKIKGAINQAILAINPIEGFDSYFIMQWLKKEEARIVKMYLQGGQGNLSGSIVKDLKLQIPNNFTEQEKIGQFFKQLDETIEGHEQKLATYQDLKKALLQRMFV